MDVKVESITEMSYPVGEKEKEYGAIDERVKELAEAVGECGGGGAAEYAVRKVLLSLGVKLVRFMFRVWRKRC